jgi:four helix bundle protein
VGVYRFEDLRVWQAAKQQCDLVGALLKRSHFRRDRELSGQMNDAAISVMFNISEGFLRRRDRETLQFLRYSFASNGELKSGERINSQFPTPNSQENHEGHEESKITKKNISILRVLRFLRDLRG